MKQRTYIAIDLKSFYALVGCRERGLDPPKTNLFDIIIEYFIENESCNVSEINGVLFAFYRSLLGA